MYHANRGWGRQAESLWDRRLVYRLQDLLSAEIQNTQFADLLVCGLDSGQNDGDKEMETGDPSKPSE